MPGQRPKNQVARAIVGGAILVGVMIVAGVMVASVLSVPEEEGVAGVAADAITEDGDAEAAADVAAIVRMTDALQFEPAQITIRAGQTVRWLNDSVEQHTATLDPDLAADPESVRLPEGAETFNSERLTNGETFEHTFETPGEYRYFCIPHEASGMVGEVTVRPASVETDGAGGSDETGSGPADSGGDQSGG